MATFSVFKEGSVAADVIRDFKAHDGLWECLIIIGCLLAVWGFLQWRKNKETSSFWADKFPLVYPMIVSIAPSFLSMIALWVATLAADNYIQVSLLKLSVSLAALIFLVRLFFALLFLAFQRAGWVIVLGRFVSICMWGVVLLYLTGHWGSIETQLDGVAFTYGEQRFSVLSVIQLLLVIGCTMLVALAVSNVIERRLLLSQSIPPNVRTILSRLSKVFLIFLGILISLKAVGFDLTLFSVFGGAFGIGLGFGMQKIMSNYVSGFLILMDESVKIGDKILIGGYTGNVMNITTRYTVLRGSDGTEAIVPNETVLGSVVTTYVDTVEAVEKSMIKRLSTRVAVVYDTDVTKALALMKESALKESFVLKSPAPEACLLAFNTNGFLLSVSFSAECVDQSDGAAVSNDTAVSKVNLNIWKAFEENNITIATVAVSNTIVG